MTSIVPFTDAQDQSEPTRIERFQSLQAGQYWRARSALPDDEITAGMVLLIESIRWVDDAPHTIILRPHPSLIKTISEHRFLLAEFLESFEFEPNHQRIRAEELRQVQDRIGELQRELVEVPNDPGRLALALQDQAGDKPSSALLPAPAPSTAEEEAAIHLATGSVVAAMGSALTPERIEGIKEAANRQLTLATAKAQWIESKTKELADTVLAMTPFFEEQVAATLAQTEDVRTYVAKLLSGIQSLDLYVGKGVTVRTLREGAHAAASEPLTVLQRKLKMDEELAVFTDLDEWFDFSRHEAFFDAIRQHADFVDQIFPTPRCVLVMATTDRYVNYGYDLASQVLNKLNREVFLLVRDGDNVHQVYSPVESHLGTSRLFPDENDVSRIFRGFDGSKIKFEDVAYTDRLRRHEMEALHYKRFLILLCGLDHRLKLFGDFYPGPPSLSFVSLDFQERYMRFVHDDDASRMLAGEGRKSVDGWINEMNAGVVAGSRVLCRWRDLMTPETAPSACEYGSSERMRVDFNFLPTEDVSVVQAEMVSGEPCVKVQVTGHKRSGPGERTFNCRVNLSRAPVKGLGAGYICLDAVSPEDLRWYIHHRTSRANHLQFIRLFKTGLKHLEAERESERPTRERLLNALREGNIAQESERSAIVDRAVAAWRSANRGKSLPTGDVAASSPVWKQLLDQMFSIARGGNDLASEVARTYRAVGWEPLRLVTTGKGQLAVYTAPTAEECDDRVEPHAWVRRILLERRGGGAVAGGAASWVRLSKALVAETSLHEWPAAERWIDRPTAFSSLEQKKAMLGFAQEQFGQLGKFAAPMEADEFARQLSAWAGTWKAANKLLKTQAVTPGMAIPIGVTVFRGKPMFLCVGSEVPHEILAALAPEHSLALQVAAIYSEIYENQANARARVLSGYGSPPRWQLMLAGESLMKQSYGAYGHDRLGCCIFGVSRHDSLKPLLDEAVQSYAKKNPATWLAHGLSQGTSSIDAALRNTLPADFNPTYLQWVTLRGKAAPGPNAWVDLFLMSDEPDGESCLQDMVEAVSPGHSGWSSSGQTYPTKALAEQEVPNLAKRMGLRAVPAQQVEDAPLPPKGRMRWYLI